MANVINCESSWNTEAIGDGGNSHGLVQIHLPSHPHITPAEATNPRFAIEFMASEMAQGNAWKWTCYRKLYE